MQNNGMKLILALIAGIASNLSTNFFVRFLESLFLSRKKISFVVLT